MIELGRFKIDLEMRTLWRDGEVVHLGSRAFDILAVVASAGGRLVSKDELMSEVWPETIVEENNIQVHLSALRKILGPDRNLIHTVPGRGYQLVGRPQKKSLPKGPSSHARSGRPLPSPKTPLVGRDHAVTQIRATLEETRVLTLVGAGGIGKTSLAVEAARHLALDFPGVVCFVELAAISSHKAVLTAILEGCGQSADGAGFDVSHVASALAGTRRLLLLDNAEHVVGHVAEIIESLTGANAALHVLVTSREPLRILPEAVFRVDALDVPPPHSTDAEILKCSAVNLFLTRANLLQEEVDDENLPIQLVGEICRRLDGIPLAIELAAARVAAIGVDGVYRRLDDRMAILGGGYRTALPRHQTLRATFDWSFALLNANSKSLFRRIAIFGGEFNLDAICAVVCDKELTVENAISGVSELVAKSLINVEFNGPAAKYRLSESTRAYAFEKLQAEGEEQEITARHARYLSKRFQTHSGETVSNGADHSSKLGQALDDARYAFKSAFSPDGNPRPSVEPASNLVRTVRACGIIEDCYTRDVQAAEAQENLSAGSVAASEMSVRTALASAPPHVRGLASEFGEQVEESMNFARSFQQNSKENDIEGRQILAQQLVATLPHCHCLHAEAKQKLLVARRLFAHYPDGVRQRKCLPVESLALRNELLSQIACITGNTDKAIALIDALVKVIGPEMTAPTLQQMLGAATSPSALMLRCPLCAIDEESSNEDVHGVTEPRR
ncbi:helix-turn-helix transcriptional regulator [Paraburkholderia hospita]|uniref:ATP-binding protein n=1 Tax=Paraburkholderia hospita TaxID=169430 RepID=UPI003ECE7A30